MPGEFQQISGKVRFDLDSAVLAVPGQGELLLVIDRPPLGRFDSSDVAAAASTLRHMGVINGAGIQVSGFVGNMGARPAFLIVRIP